MDKRGGSRSLPNYKSKHGDLDELIACVGRVGW